MKYIGPLYVCIWVKTVIYARHQNPPSILPEHRRPERDFGLETETETWVVSVSVSSHETNSLKSQYQFLRPKRGVSVSKFETKEKSLSLKLWYHQPKVSVSVSKKLVSVLNTQIVFNDLLMIFNHMTSLFHLNQFEHSIFVISSADIQHWYHLFEVSVSVSILETKVSLSLSLNFWDQSEKSWSQSQSLRQ